MKTLFTTTLILFISFISTSQISEKKELAFGKVGADRWEITESINGNDTMVYFFFGFQNKEYQSIVDIGGIIFRDTISMESMLSYIETLANKPKGSEASANFDGGRVYIYDFSTAIYLEDKNKKWTQFNKKLALQFVAEVRKTYKYFR
jgi:hypothetical protein